MSSTADNLTPLVKEETFYLERVLQEIQKRIVGQTHLLDSLMIALLTGGHLLLEGVPGLAKTLAVKSLAEAKGWNQAARLIRELVSMRPGGAASGLDPVWNFVNSQGIPRSLLVFLTDFQEPLQASHSFSAACRKHEVVFFLASDPREWSLPAAGRIRVRHSETGETMVINTGRVAVRGEYEHRAQEQRASFTRLLRNNGVDWVELSTRVSYESALRRFLVGRAGQRAR